MNPTQEELIAMTLEERVKHAPYEIWIPNEIYLYDAWFTPSSYQSLQIINGVKYYLQGTTGLNGRSEQCSISYF